MDYCGFCGYPRGSYGLGSCFCDKNPKKHTNIHEIKSFQAYSLSEDVLIGLALQYKPGIPPVIPTKVKSYTDFNHWFTHFYQIGRMILVTFESGFTKRMKCSEFYDIVKKDGLL